MESRTRERLIFAAVVLGVAWLTGTGLLIASWRDSVAADRFHSAPTCTVEQTFGPAYCQITVDGQMSGLTSSIARIDVGGRHLTVPVFISGQIPRVAGHPVRVTFYRGRVMHVEGDRLYFDANASPDLKSTDLKTWGIICFVLPTGLFLAVSVNSAIGPPKKKHFFERRYRRKQGPLPRA